MEAARRAEDLVVMDGDDDSDSEELSSLDMDALLSACPTMEVRDPPLRPERLFELAKPLEHLPYRRSCRPPRRFLARAQLQQLQRRPSLSALLPVPSLSHGWRPCAPAGPIWVTSFFTRWRGPSELRPAASRRSIAS